MPEGEASGVGPQHKGLVIVYQAGEEEPPALQAFLSKVLKAIGYDLNHDAVLIRRTAEASLSLLSLAQEQHFSHALIFGIDLSLLGITHSATPYIPLQVDELMCLPADDLLDIFNERMAGGKQRSVKLWNMLKSVFSPT